MSEPANEHVTIEIAVESVQGALAAQRAGADRIELCQDLAAGGLTPSIGLMRAVRERCRLPVIAMVRPRAGDFLYDDDEFDVMKLDAEAFAKAGADGIVTGLLTADGAVDSQRLATMIDAANGKQVTFHRAFDLCADADAAVDELVRLGVTRLLTSGQRASAPLGQDTIRATVQRAGDNLAVMAGAGVRDHNVCDLVRATGVREVHLSAATTRPSTMQYRRPDVPMGTTAVRDEYDLHTTDEAMIARTAAALRRTAPGQSPPFP